MPPPPPCCYPMQVMAFSFLKFLEHIQRRTTVGRTPLHEWSARRRDLYLTTHNTHNRQTSMPLVGFEPTIPAGERPQTYALDRAATGTGQRRCHILKFYSVCLFWRNWWGGGGAKFSVFPGSCPRSNYTFLAVVFIHTQWQVFPIAGGYYCRKQFRRDERGRNTTVRRDNASLLCAV